MIKYHKIISTNMNQVFHIPWREFWCSWMRHFSCKRLKRDRENRREKKNSVCDWPNFSPFSDCLNFFNFVPLRVEINDCTKKSKEMKKICCDFDSFGFSFLFFEELLILGCLKELTKVILSILFAFFLKFLCRNPFNVMHHLIWLMRSNKCYLVKEYKRKKYHALTETEFSSHPLSLSVCFLRRSKDTKELKSFFNFILWKSLYFTIERKKFDLDRIGETELRKTVSKHSK